ncbi:MAG TPA: 4-(cytidine 5'-diphospho)-2-C-methyl-D-erythritol kinase [Gemmatimonadota bacterium]|nr:4-(cytidine 5'-diphospho)-2-C-methyl-D-erythritol kinase [Gemmatimonadota bacterium]
MSEPRAVAREAWRAPAKINLWLEIIGRRDDGYHLVDTAYQAIDLSDTVILEPGPGVTCRVTGEAAAGVPEGEENVAVVAARALAERTGRDPRVAITIEKRIPAGAGLGGGSSDAAAVLVALARRFAVPDPAHTLQDLAESLGADVPFFLLGGTRAGRGIGGDTLAIEPPAERWGILLWPGEPVATADAYRAWDEAGRGASPEAPPAVSAAGWADRRNDLEPVVRARHPAVDRTLELLAAGPAAAARMSGSGSAAFALYASAAARDADLPRVREAAAPGARVWPFSTVSAGVQPAAGPSR